VKTDAAFVKLLHEEMAATEEALCENPLYRRLLALQELVDLYETGEPEQVPPAEAAPQKPIAALLPNPAAAPVETVDAATLPPLTEKQHRVFLAVIAAAKKSSLGRAYQAAIQERSGFAAIQDALSALRHKGYLVCDNSERPRTYTPFAVSGEIRVEQPHNARRWTDQECGDLICELAACHWAGVEPDWEKLGGYFGRSAAATENKARTERWYPGVPGGTFADQAMRTIPEERREPDKPSIPVPEQPAQPEEPMAPEEDGAVEIDVDDLSKNVREVLCIVTELHADRIHPIKEPDILGLSEVDGGRLPFILNRLRELRLVQRDSVGSLFPTLRGKEIAKDIRAEESA
jgi:hypothetical protein